jgi:hypothetical protein
MVELRFIFCRHRQYTVSELTRAKGTLTAESVSDELDRDSRHRGPESHTRAR